MNALLFDTCFLIDLEREIPRREGRAHRFLEGNRAARACLSWTVVGEFAEGFGDIHDPVCSAMLKRFEILSFEESTASRYAIVTKYLRSLNQLIGTNDLWIAAAALAHDLPLVTSNTGHFTRVPDLKVITY